MYIVILSPHHAFVSSSIMSSSPTLKGTTTGGPSQSSPALEWRHDWCLSLCSVGWALPSFHYKWGPWGWNEEHEQWPIFCQFTSFLGKTKSKVCIQTPSHKGRTSHCQAVRSSECWRAPSSFAVHMHDGAMLMTRSRSVSFCRTPTFSVRDNGVALMSTYVMFCFHIVVPCVAPCFIFRTLFKPSFHGSD